MIEDRARLKQMIFHLLSIAVKWSLDDGNGEVGIESSQLVTMSAQGTITPQP